MTNAKDYLTVDGDFTINSKLDHSSRLTDGVLELKGDFKQTGGGKAFTATNNNTVIFSGTKQQEVSFANPYTNYFCNMETANTAGVVWSTYVKATGMVKQTGMVEGYLYISNTTAFAGNTYQGDISLAEPLVLSENCKIDGNLLINNTMDLNGKELEVTKNVSVARDVWLYVNHGHLICESFNMQYCGGVYMQYEDDQLTIQKDFVICSYNDRFIKGQITVGGDITFSNDRNNFFNEDVVLEMNGKRQQTINMKGLAHSFGTLVLNNASEEGIYVSDKLNYKKLVNTSQTKLVFSNGGVLGYTLNQDETIEGDFLLSGGDMDLNGHSLTVKGEFIQSGGNININQGTLLVEKDIIQSGGSLNVNQGTLLVEGDYCLAKRTAKEDGTFTYENADCRLYMNHAQDCITVKGDIYSAVSNASYWSCSAGTLNLAGNLTLWNRTYLNLGTEVLLVLNGKEQQKFTFSDGYLNLGGFL